jgi:hypothetical protein
VLRRPGWSAFTYPTNGDRQIRQVSPQTKPPVLVAVESTAPSVAVRVRWMLAHEQGEVADAQGAGVAGSVLSVRAG